MTDFFVFSVLSSNINKDHAFTFVETACASDWVDAVQFVDKKIDLLDSELKTSESESKKEKMCLSTLVWFSR